MTNSILLGSNYAWYGDDLSNPNGNPNSFDDFGIVTNYNTETNTIISQLEQMRAAGQTTIAIPLYPIDGTENTELTNSAGGTFDAHNMNNLKALVAEIKSLGFTNILYRFMFQGQSAFPNATPSEIANNSALIANLTNEVFAPAGLPYMVDLTGEGIGENMTAKGIAYDQAIWTAYVTQFGTDHTIGFSTNHVRDKAGVNNLLQVYQGVYPAQFGIELYTDRAMPSAYQQVVNVHDALVQAGVDRPWVITETLYNDPVIAIDLTRALAVTGQQVSALYQWQIESPPVQSNVIPPIAIDAYSVLNGNPTTSVGASPGTQASAGPRTGFTPLVAGSQTITVGSSSFDMYRTIHEAVAAAQDGAVILVDPGVYVNDFALVSHDVSIVGSSAGLVELTSTEAASGPILEVSGNVYIANIKISGAADAFGTGAGILFDRGTLTIQNAILTGNQIGLRTGGPSTVSTADKIVIDHSEFSNNDSNISIGAIGSFTVSSSSIVNTAIGPEMTSAALTTVISGSVISDGPNSSASSVIALPSAGSVSISNSYITNGPNSGNAGLIVVGNNGVVNPGSLSLDYDTIGNSSTLAITPIVNNSPAQATVTSDQFIGFGQTLAAGSVSVTGNNAVMTAGNSPSTITLAGQITGVTGGVGFLTVNAVGSYLKAVGGTGGMAYFETSGSTSNIIQTLPNTSNTVAMSGWDSLDSEGTDNISTTVGNVNIQVKGTATVHAGSGTVSMQVAAGAAATVTGGSGHNQYTVDGSVDIVGTIEVPTITVSNTGTAHVQGRLYYPNIISVGGSVNIDYMDTDGYGHYLTITGGNVTAIQANHKTTVTTSAGSPGATITLTRSPVVVVSNSSDTIACGTAAAQVTVSGAAKVYASSGVLTVTGANDSQGADVYAQNGTITLNGSGGNITYHGSAQANIVVSTLSGSRLLGGAGRMTIQGGSEETIVGGRGGLVYTAGTADAGSSITTAAATKNFLSLAGSATVDSWGADTILGGTGNSAFALHGPATLYGSTGVSTVTVSGTATVAGVGSENVFVAAQAKATISAGMAENISETGGTVVYSQGSGANAAYVTVQGGQATIVGGLHSSPTVSTGGSSPTSIDASGSVTVNSSGPDAIHVANGANVAVTGAGAEIWAGTGSVAVGDSATATDAAVIVHGGPGHLGFSQVSSTMTFIGGSGDTVIDGGNGMLFINGGSGSIDVSGGSLGLQFTAGTGAATIHTSTGRNLIDFGPGATTVDAIGGGLANSFRLTQGSGGGTDVINGFRPGVDSLLLGQGLSVSSSSSDSHGAYFLLSDSTSLTLSGLDVGSVSFAQSA